MRRSSSDAGRRQRDGEAQQLSPNPHGGGQLLVGQVRGNAGQGDRGGVGRHPALRLWSPHWVCQLHARLASGMSARSRVSLYGTLEAAALCCEAKKRWGEARGGRRRTSTGTVQGCRREISHCSARGGVLTLSARPSRVTSGTMRILSAPYLEYAPLKCTLLRNNCI